MSFFPDQQPIHPRLRCSGNPMLLRQKPLPWRVLLQKTAAFLSLPLLFLLTVSGGRADSAKLKAHESAGAPNDPATVLRLKLQLEKDSPILEILATRPVRPEITTTQDPPGLRIDLNNAQMSVRHKEITVQNALIGAIRLHQIALIPTVVSIVVNERKPLSYTWDAAGNRLTIRFNMESEGPRSDSLTAAIEDAAQSLPQSHRNFSLSEMGRASVPTLSGQVNDSPVTNDLPATVWRGVSDHSMASSTTTPGLSRPGSPNRISFIRASSTTESDSGWILEFRDVCERLRAVLLLVPLLYTLP